MTLESFDKALGLFSFLLKIGFSMICYSGEQLEKESLSMFVMLPKTISAHCMGDLAYDESSPLALRVAAFGIVGVEMAEHCELTILF